MREFVCGDGGGSRGVGICGLVRGWVGELYVGVRVRTCKHATTQASACLVVKQLAETKTDKNTENIETQTEILTGRYAEIQ